VAFQQEVDPDDWVDTESRFLFPMNTLPKLLHLALPLLLFVSSCNEECRPVDAVLIRHRFWITV